MNDDGTPGVLYQPWRTTALELAGAKELGRLGISRDVQNVLFQKGNKTVLVAWSGRPVETALLSERNSFASTHGGGASRFRRRESDGYFAPTAFRRSSMG